MLSLASDCFTRHARWAAGDASAADRGLSPACCSDTDPVLGSALDSVTGNSRWGFVLCSDDGHLPAFARAVHMGKVVCAGCWVCGLWACPVMREPFF
jgi:hypothetical protein